jgi:hypothetical protein
MKTFPPFSPLHTLWLAAQCCGLKALLIEAHTRINALEEYRRLSDAQHGRDAERIAALLRRNHQLTASLHREACRG